MKPYTEEYRDGAITYYEKFENEGIEEFANNRNAYGMLLKQYINDRKRFIDNAKKFEDLKAQIDEELKEEILSEYSKCTDAMGRAKILMMAVNLQKNNVNLFNEEEMQQMKVGIESGIVEELNDEETVSEGETTGNQKEETIEEKIEELEEMTEEIEEISSVLDSDAESKNAYVGKCEQTKCITRARAEYEMVLDAYRMEMARYIVEKNELVAKREKLLLQYVNQAINTGEDLSPHLDELVNIENQILGLDREFENKHVMLKTGVENAQSNLKGTKESVRTNMVKNGIAINRQKEYIEGVLQSDTMRFPREDNKILATKMSYDDILATAPEKTVNYNMSIRVGDSVVNVSITDGENGVINSFGADGVEYANTQIGEQNRVLRDINGSLLKDYPELEQVLDRLGVNSVTELPEVCDELEEKQEEQELEQQEQEKQDDEYEIATDENMYADNGGYYSDN